VRSTGRAGTCCEAGAKNPFTEGGRLRPGLERDKVASEFLRVKDELKTRGRGTTSGADP
jgi:hypothetical protein